MGSGLDVSRRELILLLLSGLRLLNTLLLLCFGLVLLTFLVAHRTIPFRCAVHRLSFGWRSGVRCRLSSLPLLWDQ